MTGRRPAGSNCNDSKCVHRRRGGLAEVHRIQASKDIKDNARDLLAGIIRVTLPSYQDRPLCQGVNIDAQVFFASGLKVIKGYEIDPLPGAAASWPTKEGFTKSATTIKQAQYTLRKF